VCNFTFHVTVRDACNYTLFLDPANHGKVKEKERVATSGISTKKQVEKWTHATAHPIPKPASIYFPDEGFWTQIPPFTGSIIETGKRAVQFQFQGKVKLT
jgi:hypothetical protein